MTVVRLIEVTDTLTAWLEIIIKARQGIICQSSIKSGQLFLLHTSFLNNLLAIKGKEKYVFSAEARCDRVTSSEDHGVLDTSGNLFVSFSFSYMRKITRNLMSVSLLSKKKPLVPTLNYKFCWIDSRLGYPKGHSCIWFCLIACIRNYSEVAQFKFRTKYI